MFGTATLFSSLPRAVAAGQGRPGGGEDSLGAAAARSGALFGAAIDLTALENTAYASLYAREAGLLATENAFKIAALRRGPEPADIDFTSVDLLLDFAEQHKLPLRAHTLIWNDDLPGWLTALSGREVERLFDAHIEAVVSRYAGRIFAYDVVNEPLFPWRGASPDGYRRGAWFDALGPSYIGRAFRRVAALDRKAKLVLNEAFTERDDAIGRVMRPRLLRLIDDLLAAGTPLGAVGLQGHIQPQYGFAADAYGELLHEIGRRGLEIHVTELDVDDTQLPSEIAARDAGVAQLYARFAATALSEPAVKAIVTWGLSDRYSWYREPKMMRNLPAGRLPRPLPFDDRLARKPAYEALKTAFAARRA
ncbi:MAG: endo-1,4-beta-xylanase [Hyphomicrobiales bacterium]